MTRQFACFLALALAATALTSEHVAGAASRAPQAQAQTAAAAPAQSQGPDTTTATFGDWLLRCRATATGQTGARTCEVVQNIIVEGKTVPLAQLAFGRLAPTQPLYFTAVLPTNVTFPSTVRIAISDKDDQPVAVPWTRCLPAGCFASLEMTDAILKRWRDQEGPGRMIVKTGGGQDTSVPFSFRGLARALDALGKD